MNMENSTDFPGTLIREVGRKMAQGDLKEEKKEAQLALNARASPPQVIAIIGFNWDEALTRAAIAIRLSLRGMNEIERIPLPNSILLAQQILEDWRSAYPTMMKPRALVLEEQPYRVPFISRSDSYLLDRLHYGYTLLTTAIDRRCRSHLITIFIIPQITKFTPTTPSFFAFYSEANSLDGIVEWKETRK